MGTGLTRNSIPPNVVACVGGTNGKSRTYTLTKGDYSIVIQAPSVVPDDMSEADPWPPELSEFERHTQEYMLGLERIQTLLRSLDFGKTNWAYMNLHEKGGYWQINQKQKNVHRVRVPPWAPLVEEREIQYVKWHYVDFRIGFWKGEEVDVILGYESLYLKRVEDTMQGYLAMQGLGLTYEIVAHVVSGDGSIIGVVSEPEVGRLVQYRDRAKVYSAFAALQQRKLIFNGVAYHTIHILDGKVRLSNLASIRRYEDPDKLKEEGEKRHWKALERLFSTMDPNNTEPELAPGRAVKQTTLILLFEIPSPERPRMAGIVLSDLPQRILGYNRPLPARKRTSGRARLVMPRDSKVPLLIESGAEESPEADTAYITDLPLSIQTIRLRKEVTVSYHPYRSRPRPKTSLLLANSATETTATDHEVQE